MPLVTAPIVIGDNAWLAADVFVGPGVTIGELSVVGARSVVVRDLPAHAVCVGQPCRPIRDRPSPQR
jgi:putative colanic acid biosynthesis acetyltransferase WcaF